MKSNAKEILANVEAKMAELEAMPTWRNRKYLRISGVCNELSIFDWWNNNLSLTQLKDMRKFLKEAIKLGYTGYVCFKVGSTGCANGMWAHKEESTNGYSPDGDFIYKSFTPEYNYWSICKDGEIYPCRDEFDKIKTIKQFETMIAGL